MQASRVTIDACAPSLVLTALLLLLAGCETYATPNAPQRCRSIDPNAPALPTRTPLPPTVPPATSAPSPTPQPTAEPATTILSGRPAGLRYRAATATRCCNFTQAISLDPKNALLYLNRAQVYLAQQDYDGAISDFTQVIELDPRNVAAWVSRGQAHAATQNFEKPSAISIRRSNSAPTEPSVYVNRGQIIQASGDITQALESFTQALNDRSQLRPGLLLSRAGLRRRSARAATGRRSPRGR